MEREKLIKEVRSIRSFDGDIYILKNRYTARGAIIGCISGYLAGRFLMINKFISTVSGIVIGVMVGEYIGNIKTKTLKTENNVISKSDSQEK